MKPFPRILIVALTFSAFTLLAQEKQKGSPPLVDYGHIEKRLRQVDDKLTNLLQRIDIYNKIRGLSPFPGSRTT